jgi:chemotaxis protein methyltransferase CheR
MALLFGRKKQTRPAAVVNTGMTTPEFKVFQELLYDKSGIVLKENKRSLVESRVTQRLRALKMPGFSQYLDYLQADTTGEELIQLIDVISTNITHYFREKDHFEFLDTVMGEWGNAGLKKVRIWSAACSTGEEPYSMAMTVHPHMVKHKMDLKILGTDISTRVLAKAKAGVYAEDRLKTVPKENQSRYFIRHEEQGEDMYQVSEKLKQMTMYRRLNFTVFPYPIKGIFDVIFCRNAMIYFDRTLRAKMVNEFARLLKPGGYLLVGHSETLIGIESTFKTIRPSVYQRL